MGPEWVLTAWPLPSSPGSRGCPEPTQPRRRRPVCVYTHTHTHTHTHMLHAPTTCTHKPIHRLTQKQTHSCKHTQAYPCAHTHTREHIYPCGPAGSQTICVQTCRRTRHTQCWKHHPHLTTGFFQFVERACPSPSWSTLLILRTSENQAPLDHDRLCFLQKELPANLGALELSIPRPSLSCAGEGSRDTGGRQVTFLDIQEPAFPQFGRCTATGHVFDHARRLRAQGDVPEPSVRRKWGLLLLVMELDRPERNRMTWKSSGDPGQVDSVHPDLLLLKAWPAQSNRPLTTSSPVGQQTRDPESPRSPASGRG